MQELKAHQLRLGLLPYGTYSSSDRIEPEEQGTVSGVGGFPAGLTC